MWMENYHVPFESWACCCAYLFLPFSLNLSDAVGGGTLKWIFRHRQRCIVGCEVNAEGAWFFFFIDSSLRFQVQILIGVFFAVLIIIFFEQIQQFNNSRPCRNFSQMTTSCQSVCCPLLYRSTVAEMISCRCYIRPLMHICGKDTLTQIGRLLGTWIAKLQQEPGELLASLKQAMSANFE